MDKQYFLFLSVFFLIFSCQSDPKKDAQAAAARASAPAHFICQPSSEHTETLPQHEVFVKLKESKIKVADVTTYQKISQQDYLHNNIPDEAADAMSSWWAGAGAYLYIVEEDKQFLVRQKLVYEEDVSDRPFLTIAILDGNGKRVLPKLRKDDLVGIYTHSSDDMSYVLFVGAKGAELEGQYFEIKGKLPPNEELNRFLSLLNPLTINLEDFNPYELHFYSEIGRGRFEEGNGQMLVRLLEKSVSGEGGFVLQKVE